MSLRADFMAQKRLDEEEKEIKTINQLKAENEYLKKQLESTKGLVTVGSKQLIEALKENEELNKVNDEKNELLAKLGCPTIATAKRKVLCLQRQIDKLKEDNEELRKNILLRCPNCGEEYLSPEGAALYEENINLKKRIKGEIHLGNNYKEDFAKQFKQAEKYKQALLEIKVITIALKNICPEFIKDGNESMKAINEILQKIKEVENESNI